MQVPAVGKAHDRGSSAHLRIFVRSVPARNANGFRVHTIVPPLSGCDFSGHWDTNSDSCAAYGLSHQMHDGLLSFKQTVRHLLDRPFRST
jgi:hypothetical protein